MENHSINTSNDAWCTITHESEFVNVMLLTNQMYVHVQIHYRLKSSKVTVYYLKGAQIFNLLTEWDTIWLKYLIS